MSERNRIPKGVAIGGQFSASAASEAGVELTTPSIDFAAAMAEAGLEIEEFERPEGPKSFSFYGPRYERTYGFAINDDGTETHDGTDTSGDDPTRFRDSLAWNFVTRDLDKARADATAPAQVIFDEVQRIRALPLSDEEVEARRQRRIRLATSSFSRMENDVWGGDRALREMMRKDPDAFLERWDVDAERGACTSHAEEVAQGRYETCYQCRFAFNAAKHEGKLNPPVALPAVVPPMPAQPKRGEIIRDDWDSENSVSETAVSYEPDEALANALRKYAEADPTAPVMITEETWEDSSNYTLESNSCIEVKVGDKDLHFNDLGDLMRGLDGTLRGDLSNKAKMFMGPIYNEGPCFDGPAAVHRHRNHGGDQIEVGWILNHYPQDRKIDFQYADGRHDYLPLSGIKDITMTDRTREHPGYGK